jgi:hypothetical protein
VPAASVSPRVLQAKAGAPCARPRSTRRPRTSHSFAEFTLRLESRCGSVTARRDWEKGRGRLAAVLLRPRRRTDDDKDEATRRTDDEKADEATRRTDDDKADEATRRTDDDKADEATRRTDDDKADEPDIEFDTSGDSVAAAMGAAVAHILERPDSIRQRAQIAATIASAVVAALVVAAIAGLSREQNEAWNPTTIVLVGLATLAWIVTVVLFVSVVVFAQRKPAGKSYPAFVTDFQNYAQTLRKRLRRAAWSSTIALVLAVAAVAAEVYELQTSRPRERLLVLSPTATIAVGRLCGHALLAGEVRRGRWSVLGKVGTAALSRPLVAVEVTAVVDTQRSEGRKPCVDRAVRLVGNERVITVRLPKGAILASAEVQQGEESGR